MRLRTAALVGLLVPTVLAAPTPAAAQSALPLAGEGENIQPIARVPIPRATEVELAGDWAFVSTDRGDGDEGGLTIVNIADPTKPFVESRWTADMGGLEDGSYGDVDLSPDGKLAVLTNAHAEEQEEGEVAWVVLLDISDKRQPKLVGKVVDDGTTDYVHTSTLDNKTLYMNPQVFGLFPQPGNAHITVVDISDPANPVKKARITTPGSDLGLAHDSYVDHRPDGRTLLYAASIHKTDVIDVTNPLASSWLQSTTSPQYTLSHDVQPNHDRSLLVVDDEGFLGGQLDPAVSVCGKVGSGAASVDSGSVHFFKAAPDGTFADGGAVHLGSFNPPVRVNTQECVAHVFWQAPDENRMTQAYYRSGALAIDFEDPANPKELGHFVPESGGNYWSNKPHRGYLFASDLEGGLDVLRYTGEGGKRWPATAGPAEVQRSARQGVPYVPLADVAGGSTPPPLPTPAAGSGPGSGPAAAPRSLGRFAFTARARKVPGARGKRTTLTVSFTRLGKPVGKATVRKPAGRRGTVKVSGIAVPGAYRWTLKAGKRTLSRGRVTVKARKGLVLSPGATLAASAR